MCSVSAHCAPPGPASELRDSKTQTVSRNVSAAAVVVGLPPALLARRARGFARKACGRATASRDPALNGVAAGSDQSPGYVCSRDSQPEHGVCRVASV